MAKKTEGQRESSEPVLFRITPAQRERLDQMATKLDRTVTDTIKESLKLMAEKLGMDWPPTRA